MGYRSDVHALFYTTHKEDLPVLKLYMEENYPEDFLPELTYVEGAHLWGYEMVCENVKWYEGYEDVKAFDEFQQKYRALIAKQEDGKKWKFEFVRVGEDTDDIEQEQHDSSYVLSVSRQIEADY